MEARQGEGACRNEVRAEDVGKREPLEERKRMGTGSEVRIVMQVFQVAM